MNQRNNILIDVFIRPQIARIGKIDRLDERPFFLESGNPFFIKNEGDCPVRLAVIPADNEGRTFIETTFYPGWNFELIQEIKRMPEMKADLLFGY